MKKPAALEIRRVFDLVSAGAFVGKGHDQRALFKREDLEQSVGTRAGNDEVCGGVRRAHIVLEFLLHVILYVALHEISLAAYVQDIVFLRKGKEVFPHRGVERGAAAPAAENKQDGACSVESVRGERGFSVRAEQFPAYGRARVFSF